ncbi:universal stress protein [Wenyingzhuangia sp. IMCC45574]
MSIKKFQKILIGAAFSPTLKNNLLEAFKFANYFNAKLYIVHIGTQDAYKKKLLLEVIDEIDHQVEVELLFKEGKPVKALSMVCVEQNIDLLMLGALQRENLFKHYVGSVARKLTKKVGCSVLLLIKQSEENRIHKHIVVNGLETAQSEETISSAFYVATSLSSRKVTIVEEIKSKGLKVDDDRSQRRVAISHERQAHQENLRVQKIIDTVPEEYKHGVEIKKQGIYGKSGYSIGHYARVVRSDLLITDTAKRQSLLKKMLANELSFLLSELPTNVLILK